ncbi:MAG: TonB-dependent receptor domain-containing protein [Polyangiales bacterium]
MAPAAAQSSKPSGTEDQGLEELDAPEGAPEAAPENTAPKPEEATLQPGPTEPAEGAAPEATEPAPAATKAAPAAKPAASDEMVVTGSRVKHTKHALPTAVDVVDRKQLAQSGADNMSEVVRNMDINRGSEVNTAVSTAAIGTSQFNLRGLGLSSTLVLLNGRRLVMSGALSGDGSNFVDINTVPLPMLERIEILKGGASAIYGSDAVAGVVNMITRKHVNGFEAQIGGETTDKLDHHDWDVSLLGGAESEHTRVMGAVTYLKREPLFAGDRSYTDNGKNTSNLGWPSAYVRLSPVGVPVPGADQNGMVMIDPMTMQPSRYSTYLDPGCGSVPLSSVSPFPPATKVQAYCKFDFNRYFMLIASEQRVNTYTTIEHDLGDHAMVFAEAGYAHNTAYRTTSPAYPILTTVTVPADNMNNPTGNLLSWVGRVAGGNSPGYANTFDSDTLHTVAGFKGDFGGLSSGAEDWEWELSGTYGTNRYMGRSFDVLKGPLQTALNSCKPTDDPANCYNPFSFGTPNSQAIKNRITGQTIGIADTELTTAGADINGPLFRLPGGDFSLAVGGQVRREVAKYDADHDSNQDAYIFLIGAPDFQASRQVLGAYGELVMPFVRGLEVQAAGRVESYSDAGSALSPMAGLSWTPAVSFIGEDASPVSKVLVRGTYTNAFRAPSLLQEYGAQTELAPINNVTSDANGQPVTAPSSTFAAVRTLGNTGLKPQTSNAYSAGVEWSPVKGLTFTTDYWRFDYTDIIVKEKGQNIVANDFQCSRMPSTCNPNVQRNPTTGQPSVIIAHFVNASSVDTQGLDVGLNYHTDFGANAGTYGVGATGSYVFSYDIPVAQVGPVLSKSPDVSCSGGKCNVAGLRNFTTFARPIPQLRATFPINWTMDAHSAAVIVHFIGGYKDDENPDPMTAALPGISPWVSFDLQYAFKLKETNSLATTFKVGVINVLDAKPPTVNTGLGYDVLTHDPRGRMIYGRLIQEL